MDKQKRLKKIRNVLVLCTAVLIFVYIGVEPYLQKRIGNVSYFHLALFAVCLAALALVFIYQSRYGSLEGYYEDVKLKMEDAGYYLTAREEKTIPDYVQAVTADLKRMGYCVREGITAYELPLDTEAMKRNEYFYITSCERLEKSDVTAYLDAVMNEVTVVQMKRKGECVLLFVCDGAEDEAIRLSKNISRVQTSRHQKVTFSVAVVELNRGRVYCLGNRISRAQKMIVNYVMDCDFPLKAQYIGKEKLPFQLELEKELNQKR